MTDPYPADWFPGDEMPEGVESYDWTVDDVVDETSSEEAA